MDDTDDLPGKKFSDEQMLVDMALHPTPLEERDPLSFDMIEVENIKEELDSDNEYDSGNEDLLAEACYVKCEVNEMQHKESESCVIDHEISHSVTTRGECLKSVSESVTSISVCTPSSPCSDNNTTSNIQSDTIMSVTEASNNIPQCDICEKIFLNFGGLILHKKKNNCNKPFKCSLCKKSFSQSDGLKIHVKIHTDNKLYKCNVCDRLFGRSEDFRKHTKIHMSKCSLCKRSFTRIDDLKRHERSHTGSKPYVCQFCDKSFSRSDYLSIHERSHTGNKPYKCNFCEKSFSQSSNLKKHVKSHRQ